MMASLQTDEIYRRTDNILKNISEQYNPALRTFIYAGRNFEKAVAAVSTAARQYCDAMTNVGIITSQSLGSKDLGESIRQISESLIQIQVHYDETMRFMNTNVLQGLDNKLEQDSKYMVGMYRKYQSESKYRIEEVEKANLAVKKVQKKSNSVKKSIKYDDKERLIVDEHRKKQQSLSTYMYNSLKQAFIEERRRYCFFVEQQCDFAKQRIDYHQKSANLLSSQLSEWQDSCAEVKMLPASALGILDMCRPAHLPDNASISSTDGIGSSSTNGFDTVPTRTNSTNSKKSPLTEDPPQSHTLPRPTASTPTNNDPAKEHRKKVSALFTHNALAGSTQLGFEEKDEITLLIPQPRDGWHYGENNRTKQRGWFPYSYTRLIEQANVEHSQLPPDDVAANMPLPPADYNGNGQADARQPPSVSPTSQAVDPYRQMKDQLLMGNPFANVQLRKTETNDRSSLSSFQ